ncbi:glutamate synthase-related protein [Polymorphospora rubra]|uniref:Glutamate synthase n=2 Tax=Polymorphospora rubra TaxID=338584 RepID=A0A810NA95_9ACTN|nr:glutamate synthase [Polymorphospora rubra]
MKVVGMPDVAIRERARLGVEAAFPPTEEYGGTVFGQRYGAAPVDQIDSMRLVPPVFVPDRVSKLVELGREPLHADVALRTSLGGFQSSLPLYVSAFGSTQVSGGDIGVAVARQAGRLGVPMVIGENIVPTYGHYGRVDPGTESLLLRRIRAYLEEATGDCGGVVVQQSTEDADMEVWNTIYSDPTAAALLSTGRLGFELKVGQGAKPGLGGITLVDQEAAARLDGVYRIEDHSNDMRHLLRYSSPGTFTSEILRMQIRLMRNNFPRAQVWVKLHPGRDIREAAAAAWDAGADAVTVDGAEAGSGWAPYAMLEHVGLPLAECLRRIGQPEGCLLASGRMWEGSRLVKCLALGARAVGLGRAALIAVDEDPHAGLERLVKCLELEVRLLVSALGKYELHRVGPEDVWWPAERGPRPHDSTGKTCVSGGDGRAGSGPTAASDSVRPGG